MQIREKGIIVKSEPVALIAAVATIVVTVAALFNVVLETGPVETLLVDGLFIATAVLQRAKVTPTETR